MNLGEDKTTFKVYQMDTFNKIAYTASELLVYQTLLFVASFWDFQGLLLKIASPFIFNHEPNCLSFSS